MVTKVKGNGTSTFGGAISANNVSAVIPAFRAYNAGTQSITASTNTKCIFNSEDFDTANCFDSTTNYRFTPNVAGYYQFNCGVYFQAGNNSFIYLLKNNSLITSRFGGIQSGYGMFVGSDIIYANGTTDYFEVYAHNGSNVTIGAGDDSLMNFSGFLARAV